MFDIETFGEGPNVVLLHGSPVPPESVASIRDRLSESFHVIIPDVETVGLGPEPANRRLVDDLLAEGIERAAVVGHSFGCLRAWLLAESDRFEVTRIAALAPLAYYPDEVKAQHHQLADALEGGAMALGEVAETLAPQWFTDDYLAEHPSALECTQSWFDDLGVDGIVEAVRVDTVAPDLRDRLGAIDIPVYIRVGEKDGATPPDWAEEIAELLPDGRLDVVDGVGHFVHDEDREATLEAVDAFLRK